jgi:epoxyqueuosine reductase
MLMDLTQQVKDFVSELGASTVGVASIDRFDGAPRGHRPEDLLPKARSVVVFGIKLLDSVVGWDRLFRESEVYTSDELRISVAKNHFYARCGYDVINACAENFGLRTALFLEKSGHKSMYLPATYANHARIMEKIPGYLAPFSHRHAAVRAGLGEFGFSNLVVTPEFGPRVRFMSVITQAELEPDPLITDKICLRDECRLCADNCGVQGITPLEDVDRESVFMNMPSLVDKKACYLKDSYGAICWGTCIDVCPVGKE